MQFKSALKSGRSYIGLTSVELQLFLGLLKDYFVAFFWIEALNKSFKWFVDSIGHPSIVIIRYVFPSPQLPDPSPSAKIGKYQLPFYPVQNPPKTISFWRLKRDKQMLRANQTGRKVMQSEVRSNLELSYVSPGMLKLATSEKARKTQLECSPNHGKIPSP